MKRSHRRSVQVFAATGLALSVATSAGEAAERIDLFDTHGRRTGSAIVDRKDGRVDYYDPSSRRTGWGQVDATGRVERFGLDGRRQTPTALPVTPYPRRGR